MKIRKILFSIFAAAIPIAFLAVIELSLWIVDAYPQPPLFFEITEEDTSYTQINSQVGERYFDKNIMPVPNLYPQKFSSKKKAETLRIFCLGGSTTAGFPYEMTVPFPQQLALLLRADYPKHDFEVINLGLSAINSFTVVDWMPEILKQEPDLITLYMGHNEFYGAYGTGSTISLGHDGRIVRAFLKLQKYRVVQMIGSIIHSFSDSPPSLANPTLMEKMIDDKFIESNSLLRIKTRDNFSANLNIIIKACKSADVPVILSNLVSNIKDQTPLDVTSNPLQKSSKAHTLYLKGLHEFEQGDTITAYISLTRAKNNDQVPFRGIDYLNEIIQVKAGQFSQPIVDMKSAFRRASSSSIPGNDLFSDHLHPNPIGYHLMAREFRKAIDRTDILPLTSVQDTTMQPILVTDLDWEIGGLQIFKLLQRWPFGNSSVDYENYSPLYNDMTVQLAKEYLFDHHVWGKAHSDMAEYYLKHGDLSKACREYQAIIEMHPEKTEYYTKLVECAKQAHLWELVKQTSEKALGISATKGMFYFNLAISHRMTENIDEAMTYIELAVKAPELTRVQSANVHFTYARFLLEVQKPAEAVAVLTELVGEVPDFIQARELLNKLMN